MEHTIFCGTLVCNISSAVVCQNCACFPNSTPVYEPVTLDVVSNTLHMMPVHSIDLRARYFDN